MPMSFMVACNRSRSLRSSSSSCVSSLRAPLTLPGLSVRGRRLEFASGFLSFSPLKKGENARQSNDNERRFEREGGKLLGGGESNVVSFSARGVGFGLDPENREFLRFGFLSASAEVSGDVIVSVGVAGDFVS